MAGFNYLAPPPCFVPRLVQGAASHGLQVRTDGSGRPGPAGGLCTPSADLLPWGSWVTYLRINY